MSNQQKTTPNPSDLAREAGRTAAEKKAEQLGEQHSARDLPENWDPRWTLPVPATSDAEGVDLRTTAVRAAQEYWEQFVSDRRDEESIERE